MVKYILSNANPKKFVIFTVTVKNKTKRFAEVFLSFLGRRVRRMVAFYLNGDTRVKIVKRSSRMKNVRCSALAIFNGKNEKKNETKLRYFKSHTMLVQLLHVIITIQT